MIRNSVLKRWGGAFGNASAEECNNREQKRSQCKRFKNGCVRDERNDEGNQISIGATCLVLTAIKQREKNTKSLHLFIVWRETNDESCIILRQCS